MPDASGSDVARILKEDRPSIRVLFMSAYPADLLVQQGRIQPGTKTLEKPFDGRALAVAVQEILPKLGSGAGSSA
jgi:two-component system, cell cycle sensor histidine kinase and response regulator CckA